MATKIEVSLFDGGKEIWRGIARAPLELGRQTTDDPVPLGLLDLVTLHRLVIAPISAVKMPRRAVRVECSEHGQMMVTNLDSHLTLRFLLPDGDTGDPLTPGETVSAGNEFALALPDSRILRCSSACDGRTISLSSDSGNSLDSTMCLSLPDAVLAELSDDTLCSGQLTSNDRSDSNASPKGSTTWHLPSSTGSQEAAPSRRTTTRLGKPAFRQRDRVFDMVHFAIYAPQMVKRNSSFLISVWAFLEAQRDQMHVRASRGRRDIEVGSRGPAKIQRGTDLTLCLHMRGFDVASPIEVLHWGGEIANGQFAIDVPESCENGIHLGTMRVFAGGIQLMEVLFEVTVGDLDKDWGTLDTREKRIRSVFASYAHHDQAKVLQWSRGAQAVGIDVFLDVLSLRAGSNWQEGLAKAIDSRDLFCLFWSKASSRSKWVQWEWKHALEYRGCEFIQPVPLVDPTVTPPPPELASCLHFEDVSRIVLEYRRLTTRDRLLKQAALVFAALTLCLALIWWFLAVSSGS